MTQFPNTAPLADFQFYRSYSRRKSDGTRESWQDAVDRNLAGLVKLGKLTPKQAELMRKYQETLKALPSGRWLWVGGTDWAEKPENFAGAYNCSSTEITDVHSFGMLMNMAMTGCGTGAMLEPKFIDQLPVVRNRIDVNVIEPIGRIQAFARNAKTVTWIDENRVLIDVGDSRQGWVDAYEWLIDLAFDGSFDHSHPIRVNVRLGNVRPEGEPLKGFGGVSNPVKLPELFPRVVEILNGAVGRKLNSVECCLLIDEAAACVVAGNIRRSAGMRQGASTDQAFVGAKDNLWQELDGVWTIDPKRDALRMANHTRVFHHLPSLDEIRSSVNKQFHSGEGAIQFAPEAIARANADLISNEWDRRWFITQYVTGDGENAIKALFFSVYGEQISEKELNHRLNRYGLNPCGEIVGSDFFCNLSEVHLNQLDPTNWQEQDDAFRAAALSVVPLLHHKFVEPRQQYSREIDPIVGVSFTGLFDFFVHAFGVDWLRWWAAGRPESFWVNADQAEHLYKLLGESVPDAKSVNAGRLYRFLEEVYLRRWRTVVEETVEDYCLTQGLRVPNRCTTVQPAGSKSLLTGASSGWHPPKAQRFIRRMTFRRSDPIALAARDIGYNIVPSQTDKDDNGNLLDDPYDPRCTEWLVEVPVEVSWANLPGADEIEIEKFSALAQFDFWMQVQKHYTTHNTSATIELTQDEIEPLAQRIYEAIRGHEGYISVALLARFDAPFPRLPFEKIDRETYEQELVACSYRAVTNDFQAALAQHDIPGMSLVPQDAACEGLICEIRR